MVRFSLPSRKIMSNIFHSSFLLSFLLSLVPSSLSSPFPLFLFLSFLCFCFCFCFLWKRVLLCRSCFSQTSNPPASASWVLGLQVCNKIECWDLDRGLHSWLSQLKYLVFSKDEESVVLRLWVLLIPEMKLEWKCRINRVKRSDQYHTHTHTQKTKDYSDLTNTISISCWA